MRSLAMEREREADPTFDREAELIAAAQHDARAFAPLYRHYAPLILRYCQRALGNATAADDATSQVFI